MHAKNNLNFVFSVVQKKMIIIIIIIKYGTKESVIMRGNERYRI
jgi:hypothetical protein